MVGQPYLSGSLQADFDSRIRAMPNVRCLGESSQDEVNALLDRAHLLINTSKWEGFSNTFIQAWMRSVPVITLGVNPDGILDREGLGWCFDSVEEIAKVVGEVAANPDMLEAVGERARQYAIRNFSLDNASELAGLLVTTGREFMGRQKVS
jgi:glycosyltransferase involved in cell wall biosynthesis